MAFYPLERLMNLYDGYCRSFIVAGQPLLLIQEGGQRYLLRNQCPHQHMPLTKATISNGFIQCPIHGMRFSLRTGGTQDGCSESLQFVIPSYDGITIGVVI